MISASWATVIVCIKVWIVLASVSCLLISLLNRCLINKTVVTWQVTAVRSVTVTWMRRSVNLWMYSYKVSLAAREYECTVACIFVATGLNTWQSHFLTFSHVHDVAYLQLIKLSNQWMIYHLFHHKCVHLPKSDHFILGLQIRLFRFYSWGTFL